MISKFIFNAVDILDPEGTTSISVTDDDTDQILFLSNPKNITVQQIIDKIPEAQAEYDALAYSRKREAEYPSIQECVHAILDDDLDALKAKRAEIKTKYPKGD